MKVVAFFSVLAATAVSGFAPVPAVPSKVSSASPVVSRMVASPLPMDDNDSGLRTVPIPPRARGASTGVRGDVMVDPDFKWAFNTLAVAPIIFLVYPGLVGLASAGFHVVLAAILASQTNRVRLVFGKDSFELFNLSGSGKYLKEKPSNYVKGTVNRWRYDDIVDYGFFPSKDTPFVIYFKETDTPLDQWKNSNRNNKVNEYWGKMAGLIADPSRGVAEGQPHFMPALFDAEEFMRQMELRGVKSRCPIGPKK